MKNQRPPTEGEKRILRTAKRDGRIGCPHSIEDMRVYMTSLYKMARKGYIYRAGRIAYITDAGRGVIS